ncbi:Hypothetical protein NTJ_12444 [Nesidiocoris tenuis]|uniref:Uncharacterized protein n=1 Tax=Nesidiocoris tenuis TaxID=355587 RepID=A0ABN7B5D8_9HEMI|nr:Hypothetical protein NTJ_12444 [Nesidiocoris tenuis]
MSIRPNPSRPRSMTGSFLRLRRRSAKESLRRRWVSTAEQKPRPVITERQCPPVPSSRLIPRPPPLSLSLSHAGVPSLSLALPPFN